MRPLRWLPMAGLALVALLSGCQDAMPPTGVADPADPHTPSFILNETDLVTVAAGGSALTFWPYTGRSPTLGDHADPINLILRGGADPVLLRAKLLFLSGDRTAFGMPPVFPFNCTWSDAIGESQAVLAQGFGWSGSAVQLQCGTFGPLRFHLRFFPFGNWTLANAHFDMLIPGTTAHAVVSWELAEQLAMVDFLRLGGALSLTDVINEAPTFRQVLPAVFAGMPADLLGLLLATGSIQMDGSLLNDGHARVLMMPPLVGAGAKAEIARQEFTIDFNQIIERPFCTDDGQDYLHVSGPIELRQQVVVTPSGKFVSHFRAMGHLDVTLVNPLTGQPLAPAYRALVNQHTNGVVTDAGSLVTDFQLQMEIRPQRQEKGTLRILMQVRPGGIGSVDASFTCKS